MTRNKFKKGDLVVHKIAGDLGIVVESFNLSQANPGVYRIWWRTAMSETIEVDIDLVSWKQHNKESK